MSPEPVPVLTTIGKPIVHAARTYQQWAGSNYCLPSDEPERARLLLQHNLLKKAFDGRVIYPPVEFTDGSVVLDCGSGSGTWITDAASLVPSHVSLYGIDIEPRLFPSPAPSNVRFSVGSATALPADWTDTFDLVSQRLLIAALRAPEWGAALRELFRVAAPGGYVQLGEAGAWRAGARTERQSALTSRLFEARGLILYCARHIPPLLREAGFEDVVVEERRIPLGKWAGQDGVDGRDNFIGVFRGMKTPILNAGGFDFVSSEQEYDALMDDVEAEWDSTPGAEIGYFVFTARKPLPTEPVAKASIAAAPAPATKALVATPPNSAVSVGMGMGMGLLVVLASLIFRFSAPWSWTIG